LGFSGWAHTDFLPRSTGNVRVCAFPYRKSHEVRQRHQPPQEIRRSGVLCVAEKGLEAIIHVLLNVAMKQRQAWLVGNKVHHGTAIIRNYNRVF
jgi:hypothetical protein